MFDEHRVSKDNCIGGIKVKLADHKIQVHLVWEEGRSGHGRREGRVGVVGGRVECVVGGKVEWAW